MVQIGNEMHYYPFCCNEIYHCYSILFAMASSYGIETWFRIDINYSFSRWWMDGWINEWTIQLTTISIKALILFFSCILVILELMFLHFFQINLEEMTLPEMAIIAFLQSFILLPFYRPWQLSVVRWESEVVLRDK